MNCAIIIPARMASTRFPGKPLIELGGKPMIQWVHEACIRSSVSEEIWIATPDQEILDAVSFFGGKGILTSSTHASGTDRLAEVSLQIRADFYINVQGDEPLVPANAIQKCASLMVDSVVQMATLYTDCLPEDIENPAVVKVVTDLKEFALYFSRFPIPFLRDPLDGKAVNRKRHIGMYAYRPAVLEQFSSWEQSPLELAESLEQLRFLENGIKIKSGYTAHFPTGVDTPAQAEEVRKIIRNLPT